MNNQNEKNPTLVEDQQRRRILVGLASIVGASVANELLSGDAFSVAMAHAESGTRSPKVMNGNQLATLKVVCQTVIPATDTAGAGDVDTHHFIDNQLFHCFDKAAQTSIVEVVTSIEDNSNSQHKTRFSELSLTNATALLNDIDTGKNGLTEEETSAFKFLKSLIVFGYYTSEVGASKELRYDAVPGGFKANVSLEKIGSAWGSRAFF